MENQSIADNDGDGDDVGGGDGDDESQEGTACKEAAVHK